MLNNEEWETLELDQNITYCKLCIYKIIWPIKIKVISSEGEFLIFVSFTDIYPDENNSVVDGIYKKEHIYKLNKPKIIPT